MKITIEDTKGVARVHYIVPTLEFVNHLDQVHSFSDIADLHEPNEDGEDQFDQRVCTVLKDIVDVACEERRLNREAD